MDVTTRVRQRIWTCISGAPWAASEVGNDEKKTIQLVCYCQVFAKHSCTWKWAVFWSTRSGNLEAVRLQGHIHRIFPEALHQRKREDKLQIWKRDCPGQFLCGSQGFLSEKLKMVRFPVPQTDRFLTTFCIKRHLFCHQHAVAKRWEPTWMPARYA